MDRFLTRAKWQQFLEDVYARWDFLDVKDDTVRCLNDVALQLTKVGGFSSGRSEREVMELLDLFKAKIQRAA